MMNSRGTYLFEFRSESGRLRTDFQLEPYHRQPRHRLHVDALSSLLTLSNSSDTDSRSSVKLVSGSNREDASLSVTYYTRMRMSDEELRSLCGAYATETRWRQFPFMEAVAARDSRARSAASGVVPQGGNSKMESRNASSLRERINVPLPLTN